MSIAKKLGISRGAVSLCTNQLAEMAKDLGVESVLEEGKAMDEIKELRDLAVDLRKAHLAPEECRGGLKTRLALAKCGVGPDDYGHLAKCAQQMSAEGYADAAIHLAKLEAKTGLNYNQLVTSYEDMCHHLEARQLELTKTTADMEIAKKERANAIQQRTAAVAELQDSMQKVGVDGERLKKVEALALALKKAGADKEELDAYLQRQQLLNQSGMTIDSFAAILQQTAVITGHDKGAGLLAMLKECGGLAGAIKAANSQVAELEKRASGLGERINEKEQTEKQLAGMKAQQTALQTSISLMGDKKQQLVEADAEVQAAKIALSALQEKAVARRQDLSDLETQIAGLKETVADLQKVEAADRRHWRLSPRRARKPPNARGSWRYLPASKG